MPRPTPPADTAIADRTPARPARLPTAVAAFGLAAAGAGLFAVAYEFAGREATTFAAEATRPSVGAVRPADDDAGILPTTAVAADVVLPDPTDGRPSNGVDPRSLTPAAVRLYRHGDPSRAPIPAVLNTSGAGDAIVLTPTAPLTPTERYVFEVTAALKDETGASFRPHRSTFAVAAGRADDEYPVAFEKVALPVDAAQSAFTALVVGPDGRLYAGTFDGRILRYPLAADGTPGEAETIPTLIAANGGPRLITGLTFAPGSTADAMTLWVSHGQMAITPDGRIEGADDFTGKLSTLAGPSLADYRDRVVNLPRAYKDHLNFQGAFGPDGAYYFTQGSHTSAGAPDAKWGRRPERLLSAAMLRLDVAALDRLTPDAPLDVRTPDAGGAYDPASGDAPLTVYAAGVRSGYDVLWHTNGRLYTAVNGAASGGNAPAGGGAVALAPVSVTQDDLLLAVEPGGYYGHPNPARNEHVLAGGNPTAGIDPQEIPDYPVGTPPNPNYRPPAFVFGKNVSPNGMVEYRNATAFGGRLRGALLVARYSVGDDVVILLPAADGRIAESILNVDGLRQFVDPLDLAEDPATGNVYVAEYGGRRINLLRPIEGGVSRHAFRRVEE